MTDKLYLYRQESLDELSSTAFSYDLTEVAGNIEYRNNGISIEDVPVPGLKGTVARVFNTPYGKKYKYAFYTKNICTTRLNVPYIHTWIYYFDSEESVRKFIQINEPETYRVMNKENILMNTFIYKNNNN